MQFEGVCFVTNLEATNFLVYLLKLKRTILV